MKGQAAMEYLMTYGWAVLVIVIVIAALFSFTQFFKVGEQCLFSQKTFSCSDPSPQVLSGDGKIIFTLKNLGQKGVEVHSFACITEDSEVPLPAAFTTISGGEIIPTGSAQTFSDDTYKCKRNGGALELTAGSEFRGKLIVKYNYEDEPAEYSQRQADASLTATVVAATSGGDPDCPGGVCTP